MSPWLVFVAYIFESLLSMALFCWEIILNFAFFSPEFSDLLLPNPESNKATLELSRLLVL